MTQLSKERLEEIAEDGFLKHGEGKEMARRLLAAEAQEPVILYRERNPYNGMVTGWQELTQQDLEFIKDNASENAEFKTLYAAPQPVAVPDAFALIEEAWRLMDGQDPETWEWHSAASRYLNACRAAMLKQPSTIHTSDCACSGGEIKQPASKSLQVPEGWIPCSERMPEESGRYWCYVEEQNSLGKSHYQWNCSWNGDVWSDKALTGRVTHWMPLPAAPQPETD